MRALARRLSNMGLQVYTDDQMTDMVRRTIVEAFRHGRFSDALPDPYIHEIAAFAKQSLADGSNRICIQLITGQSGLASFLYDIGVSSTGITISSAVDWHVPKKSGDRKIPTSFEGIPRMAIDVSPTGS